MINRRMPKHNVISLKDQTEHWQGALCGKQNPAASQLLQAEPNVLL